MASVSRELPTRSRHHVDPPLSLPRQEVPGKVGIGNVEGPKEGGTPDLSQALKSSQPGPKDASVGFPIGDPQAANKGLANGEEMPKDVPKPRLAPQRGTQVGSRVTALHGHREDSDRGSCSAKRFEGRLRKKAVAQTQGRKSP